MIPFFYIKKTDSKLLMLIKFKNQSNTDKVTAISMGEINKLISISNKENRVMGNELIELDCLKLKNKLLDYKDYIESIEIILDEREVKLLNFIENEIEVDKIKPNNLL